MSERSWSFSNPGLSSCLKTLRASLTTKHFHSLIPQSIRLFLKFLDTAAANSSKISSERCNWWIHRHAKVFQQILTRISWSTSRMITQTLPRKFCWTHRFMCHRCIWIWGNFNWINETTWQQINPIYFYTASSRQHFTRFLWSRKPLEFFLSISRIATHRVSSSNKTGLKDLKKWKFN